METPENGVQEFSFERVRALAKKEFQQIRRDRRLAISLLIPPTLQMLLLGSALSANVANLKMGVVDESRTHASRELVAVMSESKSFQSAGDYLNVNELTRALSRGEIDAGMVIPYAFARDLERGRPVTVQFLLNAMNANTAAIAQGYAQGVIQSYNQNLARSGLHANFRNVAAPLVSHRGQPEIQPVYFYNPGLRDSWFIVTGVLGLLVILNSSLISAATMVKEREAGTIEQLLMSPASAVEIMIAKIAPIFALLFMMGILSIGTMLVVFRVPFRGSISLVVAGICLCIFCGIGIGTANATFSRTAQQATLLIFFINPPLNSLAGALNPVEAMPKWLQPVVYINPIHHFATIVRGAMLKGSGFATLWPNFLGLFLFTACLVSVSAWRFRKQLS